MTVPEGTPVLKVNLSGVAAGSVTRFLTFNPYGVGVEDNSSLNCYKKSETCDPRARSYDEPMPGVWELAVESRRTSPFLANPFTLTAQVQGVAVDPRVTTVPSAAVGSETPVTWKLTNQFAPVTVTPQGGPLGSAHVARETVADGAVDSFDVAVPAGASRLDVSIGSPSDPGADLDLAVLLNGEVVAQDADGDSEESVTLENPTAGTYTVEVDGYDVPTGTTAYDYREVFYASSLGSLVVPSAPITLAAKASAPLVGAIVVDAAPASGRSLVGELVLTDPDRVEVGRAAVVIESVTG